MPHEVRVSAEHRLGVIRFSGVVEGDTILCALDELYNGETWVPTFNMIWDCRPIVKIAVGPREANRILERLNALTRRVGEGRTAVISPQEMVSAFVHMLFVRDDCSLRERKVFGELDDALQWVIEMYPEHAATDYSTFQILPV